VNIAEKSLHYLVEKWLAPDPEARIRVVRFGHIREDRTRYVHVEASASSGPRAIFFFRHNDGCWCVFPPRIAQPSMTGYRLAA
jgi:hypothetical protein